MTSFICGHPSMTALNGTAVHRIHTRHRRAAAGITSVPKTSIRFGSYAGDRADGDLDPETGEPLQRRHQLVDPPGSSAPAYTVL